MPSDDRRRWEQSAMALAGMGSLVARLIAEHRPDDLDRCVACTRPGYGSPHQPWPCTIRRLAVLADVIRRSRHGPG